MNNQGWNRYSKGRSGLPPVLIGVLVLIAGFSFYMIAQGLMSHHEGAASTSSAPQPIEAAQAKSVSEDILAGVDLTHDPVYKGWLNGKAGFDQARQTQKTTHQPMVVYFYAPWCPHCKEFHLRVLKSPLVQKALGQYLLVRNYPDHDAPSGQADNRMMHEFGADGFPTMYIANPGKRFIRVDLAPQDGSDYYTPSEFVGVLKTTLKNSD